MSDKMRHLDSYFYSRLNYFYDVCTNNIALFVTLTSYYATLVIYNLIVYM